MDRFWCPPDRNVALDGFGYLAEPQTRNWLYGQSLDAVRTEELSAARCLLLLGEPGMGKSTVLAEHAPLLPAGVTCPVVTVELNEYGEDRLVREVLEGPAVQEWQAGTGQLCLVLDGLDEGIQHIPQLASILSRRLRSWPCDRLWLRIACRTAQWPSLLASAVEAMFPGEHRELELLPLRRSDVAALAAQWTDPDPFLRAVEASKAVPLASRPLTCRLLAKAFAMSGGTLPGAGAALYERGLLALCEEHGESRRAAGLLGRIPAGHRLAVASRLAAVTLFSGRSRFWTGPAAEVVGQDQCSVDELSGGTEPVEGEAIAVTTEAVREALQTALFSGRGPQLLGWAHATFTDYLAARWIVNANLANGQVRSLLLAEDGRVYPQIRLTAAWLIAIDPDQYRWLALADADAFTGEVELPGDGLRAAVVDGLFTAASRITRRFGRTYAGLAHPGLPDQIHAGLVSPDHDMRDLAIQLARDCEVKEARDELIRLALDATELEHLRVAAAYAVISLEADAPSDALLPLVQSDVIRGPDPRDELFGSGLRASWPHALNSAEVFRVLKAPTRRNFHGAYVGFLYEFADGLIDDVLPAALAWLRSEQATSNSRLAHLRNAIIRLAARNIHQPEALSALVEIVQTRAIDYGPLYEDDHVHDIADPFADRARRRTLIEAVLDCGPDNGVLWWLARESNSSAHLVRREDLGWIADRCAAACPEHRSAWIALFQAAFRDDDLQHLDLALSMDPAHPLYEAVVGEWIRPIAIHGPVADQLRQQWQTWNRHRVEESTAPDRFDAEISRLLDQVEAGNADAFWQAVRLIHVRPGTERYSDEHIPDVTALPRWKRMPQQIRDRFVAAAPVYLRTRLCNPSSWLDQPIIHHPSRAAYQALVLLLRHRPEALDQLTADDWREWAPAIVSWTVTINGAQPEDKELLIKRALPHAHSELVAALKAHIDGTLSRSQLPFVTHEAGWLWNDDLADYLERYLRDGITDAAHDQLLTILVRHDTERARVLLLDWLTEHAIADQPDRAKVAAANLLDHDVEGGLSTFLALTRGHPQLAQEVLLTRNSIHALTVPPGTPDQLAELYVWLMRTYPSAEDPDYDEVHAIGPREEIGNWRNVVLDRLMSSGVSGAPEAIRRIATQFPAERWLARVEASAQEAVRQAQWAPIKISELRRLSAESRALVVRNTAELQRLVVDALATVQQRLQGATPQAHLLWDNVAQRPKDEDDLSDYLEGQLTSLIGGRGVVVNREVQVRRTSRRGVGERVDLHIAAADPWGGETLAVVVEVKGAWNTGLFTSLRQQLVDRYLADVGSRHGIYCVGWYSTTKWEAQIAGLPLDSRRAVVAGMDRDEMTQELQQQADKILGTGVDVKVVVLDVSYARPGT